MAPPEGRKGSHPHNRDNHPGASGAPGLDLGAEHRNTTATRPAFSDDLMTTTQTGQPHNVVIVSTDRTSRDAGQFDHDKTEARLGPPIGAQGFVGTAKGGTRWNVRAFQQTPCERDALEVMWHGQ